MNAVIYARYSSHAQKDASIEQQIRECRKFAGNHDLRIVGEYCDHAISGTSDRRPEFMRMIKDSVKGKWQRVLVYKVDRFARNRYDSAMYKARLKKNGVKVMSVMEPIPEGPEGILLESVLEGSAEYYSANLSQNIRRGMEDNALSCKVNNGRLPLGFKKGDDGRYAIEPTGVAIAREIFERYANGENVREITDELNARGILTSHGARWNKNSLHTILKNERYAGVYIWSNIRVEGGIPAIVSRELFDAVKDRLRIVAKAPAAERTNVDYLLTGKLFCGRCGSPMTGESGTGKGGKKFYYYTCVGRKRSKTCNKKPVKKDWIEETVVRQTRKRCLTDEMIRAIVDSALELQEREKDDSVLRGFEAELVEVKLGIGNILKAIEQGIITPSTKERLEELEARRLDLEEAIEGEKIEQPQLTREQLTFWLERFRDGDPRDRSYWSTFIDVFVSAVYVYDDHLRIVCNFTGEKGAITFDFVNGIEDYEEAVEVFDFDTHASTSPEGRAANYRINADKTVTSSHEVFGRCPECSTKNPKARLSDFSFVPQTQLYRNVSSTKAPMNGVTPAA